MPNSGQGFPVGMAPPGIEKQKGNPMNIAVAIDRSFEPRRPAHENLNTVVVFSLALLVAGMTASGAYVPFTGNEPGTLYLYHLDGPGDDTANVILTSGKTGGTMLTDAFTVSPTGTYTPLKSEPSPYGGCAYFEAPIANLPSTASIAGDSGMPSTTRLYVDFWAKPYLEQGYYKTGAMVSKNLTFALYNNPNGSISSFLGTGTDWDNTASITSAAGVFTMMQWAHIQLQYNGSVVRLLVNNQVVGSTNWTGTIAGGSASLTLGNWTPTNGTEYYGGMLDEVWVGTSIPEPAMIGLLGLGLLGLIGRRNRG